MNLEKYNKRQEADRLLLDKERLEYARKLLPLLLKSKSVYGVELSVGNLYDVQIISVMAYERTEGSNSSITIYAFDGEENRSKKLKLIKDMFLGEVELSDFCDMKLLESAE